MKRAVRVVARFANCVSAPSRRVSLVLLLALLGLAAIATNSLAETSQPAPPLAAQRGTRPTNAYTVRELPTLKTANSNTFLLSDGTREAVISSHPVNYRNSSGEWSAINDELAPGSGGTFHPAASPVPVSLPASLASGAVTVGHGETELSFALQGAQGTQATVAGNRRTYTNAIPGVSVGYTATSQAVREVMTLQSASAPSTYEYSLSYGSDLNPVLTPADTIEFRDASGKTVYTVTAPTVSDSGGAASRRPHESPVHYELKNAGKTLLVSVDKSWLQSSTRVFPVKIDPDVYYGDTEDCSLISGSYASYSGCGGPLYVGPDAEEPHDVGRALVRFDLSDIPRNSTILSSSFALWFRETTSASPVEVELHALNRAFTQSATWNTYDGTHAWTAPGGDFSSELSGSQAIHPEWVEGWTNWGLSPLVERWVQNPTSNYGLLLKAHDETKSGYDTFGQSYNGEGIGEPNIHIIYSSRIGYQPGATITAAKLAGGAQAAVNVTNGNLLLSNPDVVYSGTGYETQLTRYYNSQDENLVGSSFGPGWLLSAGNNELLYPAWWDEGNVFHEPGGAYARFDASPVGPAFRDPEELTFGGPGALNAGLTVYEEGTRKLTYGNSGTEWLFDKSENGFPQEIVEHEAAGNTLAVSYHSSELEHFSDSHGHSITLPRIYSLHHVTKMEGGGQTWHYSYNSSQELSEYKTPAGQKIKYSYSSAGVDEIQDPSGTYVISYDGSEPQRVTSIRRLVNGTVSKAGSEDEITSYEYIEPHSPACNPSTETGETIVSYSPGERAPTTYCYNENGEVADQPQRAASSPVLGDGPTATIDYSAYDSEIPVAIDVANGNAVLTSEEFMLPNSEDVYFAPTLNTLATASGDVGAEWRQNWGPDVTLTAETGGAYSFTEPTGGKEKFTPTGSGGFKSADEEYGTLETIGETHVVTTDGGDTYVFSSSGKLTSYKDANESEFTLSYTTVAGQQRLAAVKDPGGTETTFRYNPDGTITEVHDPAGEPFYYRYTPGWERGVRLLASVTNGTTGEVTTVSYDPVTWLADEIAVSDGHVTKLSYDSSQRISKVEQIDTEPTADVVTTIAYKSPTSPECETADIGETIVSGGQDEGEQTYCYTASGEVTNPIGGD